MTNYFSRLARTTGLHFGAAPTPRAAPEHEATPARTPLAGPADAPPPHVEEWTFVESEPAPAAHDKDPTQANAPAHESALSQSSIQEENHVGARVLPPAEQSVFADERPLPGERAADSRPPAFFEKSRVELVSQEEEHSSRTAAPRERTGAHEGEPPAPVAPSLSHTSSEQESLSPPARPMEEMLVADVSREDAGRGLLETLEAAEAAPPSPEAPALPARAEPAASPAAQADSRRAYLREVVEWITSPADAARELDGEGEMENPGPLQSKTSQPAAVVLQRERVEAARELEVQDFSLSIGSISIVVEDAPRPAPAPAPAHRPEPEQRQPAPVETSRLRRRYIRGL